MSERLENAVTSGGGGYTTGIMAQTPPGPYWSLELPANSLYPNSPTCFIVFFPRSATEFT